MLLYSIFNLYITLDYTIQNKMYCVCAYICIVYACVRVYACVENVMAPKRSTRKRSIINCCLFEFYGLRWKFKIIYFCYFIAVYIWIGNLYFISFFVLILKKWKLFQRFLIYRTKENILNNEIKISTTEYHSNSGH